jgi:integrase
VHTLDPRAAELIPAGLIPAKASRRIPYLCSEKQVVLLMQRARALSSPRLAASISTLIGLLAVTGLRGGEAAALDIENLDVDRALLRVNGKYGKQRTLPLHHSTVKALTDYVHETRSEPSGPLLIGERGGRLNMTTARERFRALVDSCRLPARPGCTALRLHDLRHRFAVASLIEAHRDGVDADARIAALANYLGHSDPTNTYWYLTASPQLMAAVRDRITAHPRRSEA